MSDSLALIQQSGLLDASDQRQLATLMSDVSQSFETAQVFRTQTEMRVSVLNDVKHPTPDSKYWQAVREQDVHFTELVHLSYEYRKKMLEIKRLERDRDAEEDDLERAMLDLEIEHQNYILMLMRRQAHHRTREVASWAAIKDELRPLLKYGDADVNSHQLEAMRIRFGNEARLVNDHTPVADARNVLALAMQAEKESK